MISRLLNMQGVAGAAIVVALAIMLIVQNIETRRWKAQSSSLERLYRKEQSALAKTVAEARAAAAQARATDQANAQRVAAEQAAINERTMNDYEARLAAARTTAQRLRVGAQAAADRGARRNASMPGLPAAAGAAAQAARENRLPSADALMATEQAIQLDELIRWVEAQSAVDPDRPAN